MKIYLNKTSQINFLIVKIIEMAVAWYLVVFLVWVST